MKGSCAPAAAEGSGAPPGMAGAACDGRDCDAEDGDDEAINRILQQKREKRERPGEGKGKEVDSEEEEDSKDIQLLRRIKATGSGFDVRNRSHLLKSYHACFIGNLRNIIKMCA